LNFVATALLIGSIAAAGIGVLALFLPLLNVAGSVI